MRTVVKHPIEQVFDYVADMHNDEHWAPFVHNVTQVAGDRPGVGATYSFTQHLGEHRIEMESTITVYERPRRLRWEIEHKAMDYEANMAFEPVPRGTRITQTNFERWTYAPWWLRLAGPIVVRRQLRRQLALLERALDKERREEENVQAYLDSNSA